MQFDKAEGQNPEKQEAPQPNFDVVKSFQEDQLSKNTEKSISSTDKANSSTDTAKDSLKELNASQIADLIIKNKGFGAKGSEDRDKIDSALGKAFDKSMKNPDTGNLSKDENKDLAKKVNEELAKKNSDLRVDFDSKGGGGGGGRRSDGLSEKHQEKDGSFSVTEKGKPVDEISMHGTKDTVYDKNGKVVGERSSRESENGGSGGGWGKGPEHNSNSDKSDKSGKDEFKLDDFIIEDGGKGGGGGGGGGKGGGGGGKGGGKSFPKNG